jgi:hypothetical protein
MPDDAKAAIKGLIDKILLSPTPPDCVHNFFSELIRRCGAEGVEFDAPTALEYWWHLARLGFVAIPGAEMMILPAQRFPKLLLTERGRRLLAQGEKSPHDPIKYMQALRQRVQEPNDIALAYLDEAVGAWAAGLYRASAVMLGCACERLVLILADRIVGADIKPSSERVRKALGETPGRISQLFELIRTCLNELKGKKQLPAPLADALDRKLSAIFDHARGLRNQSGHPTGADVSADDAEAGLLLFPGFYELVNNLCQHLSHMEADRC